ncbi:hypothetical protein B0H13DRAFT_2367305 [Mycena leptocephala]|nr:hypothetical protein B0H13DRAFT_2367305 [Mycena leptocephala]
MTQTNPPSSTASHTRPRCIPPFYPHEASHRDVYALSDTAGQKFYVVKCGRGIGFFTNSDDANQQTDNYTNASKQSFKKWTDACEYWETLCGEEHGHGCPLPRLAYGFTASYPTPAAYPPPAHPIPLMPTTPLAASTPTVKSEPASDVEDSLSSTSGSFVDSPFASPSRHRSIAASATTPVSPSNPGPAPLLRVPARTFWAVDGVNEIFLRRGDAMARLRPGASLMVSADLDRLEDMITPAATSTPPSSPSGASPGFSTCFWAVLGGDRIFSGRADALKELLASEDVAGVSMMLSDDLDQLELFMASRA